MIRQDAKAYADRDGKYLGIFVGGIPSIEGIIEIPVPPNDLAEWDGQKWVVYEPTPEELLTTERASASVTRGQFCTNLITSGILPIAEAVAAAKGDWPNTFAAALVSMTDAERAAAEIEWAGATTILRNAPLLIMLQAFAGLSDEAVDVLFGIELRGV